MRRFVPSPSVQTKKHFYLFFRLSHESQPRKHNQKRDAWDVSSSVQVGRDGRDPQERDLGGCDDCACVRYARYSVLAGPQPRWCCTPERLAGICIMSWTLIFQPSRSVD